MDGVELTSLPEDALGHIIENLDEDAICALASVSRYFARSCESDLIWAAAAAVRGIRSCAPMSCRATVVTLRRVRRALRPFTINPPTSTTSQKLRCMWDPASAASALQLRIGKFSSSVNDACEHSISPINARERDWLNWFGRVAEGKLHLETCRVGARTLNCLHLHDAVTDDCHACMLHGADVSHICAASASGEERLVRAVDEFRHRVALIRRVSVVDASTAAGQRLGAYLRLLPPTMCRNLESLSIEGCPADALSVLSHTPPNASGGRTPAATSWLPHVIVAEQARPRVSIGHAMDVVGSLVKQLVHHDATCAAQTNRRRVQHVVFLTASRASAETLTKAVCSISFKSHLALVPSGGAGQSVAGASASIVGVS